MVHRNVEFSVRSSIATFDIILKLFGIPVDVVNLMIEVILQIVQHMIKLLTVKEIQIPQFFFRLTMSQRSKEVNQENSEIPGTAVSSRVRDFSTRELSTNSRELQNDIPVPLFGHSCFLGCVSKERQNPNLFYDEC